MQSLSKKHREKVEQKQEKPSLYTPSLLHQNTKSTPSETEFCLPGFAALPEHFQAGMHTRGLSALQNNITGLLTLHPTP